MNHERGVGRAAARVGRAERPDDVLRCEVLAVLLQVGRSTYEQVLVARDSRLHTGIVNANCGLDPVSVTADLSSEAVRGGFESTVGMTSPGALRCESVTDPSELFHMITIGVFIICFPKPLCAALALRRR